jgi:predicted nucleic acid-binding protein
MSLPRRRRWFVESSPRNILADAGPLFALIHAGDPDHARAVQFAGSYTGLLTTTWPIVTEVAYLLDKYAGRGVDRLLGMVLDGELLVADLAPVDVEYMRRLTAKYDRMDLADASLVAVGERLGVLDVITLDRHDFSRYRTRGRRAFTNHFPERT